MLNSMKDVLPLASICEEEFGFSCPFVVYDDESDISGFEFHRQGERAEWMTLMRRCVECEDTYSFCVPGRTCPWFHVLSIVHWLTNKPCMDDGRFISFTS